MADIFRLEKPGEAADQEKRFPTRYCTSAVEATGVQRTPDVS